MREISDMWSFPETLTRPEMEARPLAVRWIAYAELPAAYLTAPNAAAAKRRAEKLLPSFPTVRVVSAASARIGVDDEAVVIRNDRIAQIRHALAQATGPDDAGPLTLLPPEAADQLEPEDDEGDAEAAA